jgi:TRAP-type C4-dicarboxylate transport system permease large subunit
MSSVHFGIMMVMNLCIGSITPPVGTILFVGCRVGATSVEKVFKPLIPYYLVILLALFMVTYIPGISMWLPTVLGK